jgi:hypothetical protein
MPKLSCFYFDDSGTRNPDQRPQKDSFRDWFALGGILINEEDEYAAEALHADFCDHWKIDYPLHSFDIRQRTGRFAWLNTLESKQYDRFMSDLTGMLVKMPVTGHACVIDRPGYDARYREKHAGNRWMLCRTAFTVICERAAKIASRVSRRLRLYPEDGDPTANAFVRTYYRELLTGGMPFEPGSSAKYRPLSALDFRTTLYGLKFKRKSSALAQIADLYLYPLCRGRYEPAYRPYLVLREQKKTIDDVIPYNLVEQMGLKYSCFELADSQKH